MTTSSPATAPDLTAVARMAGVAGLASAAIVLLNSAKRSMLLPTTDALQLLAPVAEVLALGLLIGLYAAVAPRVGRAGLAAFAVDFAAVALLVGAEFAINLVFPRLPGAQVTALLDGPLGGALTTASILFVIGGWAVAAVLLRSGTGGAWAPLTYAVGSTLVGLRAFVPEWALNSGLVILAAGIAGLSLWLLTHRRAR